ncbi:MAG: IS1380 family transposase [Bacteroidales bacterium]|nr:IS1380 family transposase [Bacteroidales bacterium]
MKKISNSQSRRNIEKRKNEVRVRHKQAGHWKRQSKPMFGRGKVHLEVGSKVDAMSFGGIAPVHCLLEKIGLISEINSRLNLLKQHLPYHESDHVLNIAYNVLCGGTRLEDIERLRHDVAYMKALGADLIPDPTTAGDFTRRFEEEDVETLMETINSARTKLWSGRGAELLGPVTYVDVDGTIAPTYGERKAGMDISYKGIWGYHPLIISVANTKEVLYVVNRPGNVASHQDCAPWINKAVDLLLPYTQRICLRGDTDFSLTGELDGWAEKVDFVFGMDNSAPLKKAAEALPEDQWSRLNRKPKYPNLTGQIRERNQPYEKDRIVKEREFLNLHLEYEDVAEFKYRPGKCSRPYRVIVLRKNISKTKGEEALFDDIRYFFYITTLNDLTPAELVFCANQRCDQENVIEQLKNGVNAMRLPVYDLVSNWAYMVMATLAWNIKSWVAMMMHRICDREFYIRMEFRRFINNLILLPCQVIHRARGITVRIIGYRPSLDRLFSVFHAIERTSFG